VRACILPAPGAVLTRLLSPQVGFLAIDALAAAEGISVTSQQMRAVVGRGTVAGTPVLLVKPQTFMNSSGESVVPLLKYYKVPPSRCLVLYDDLDIDVAALRLRQKGGHGGHNGMRSIITCLGGSQDFPRLRIGIGRPQGSRQVIDHVLTTFDKHESADIEVSIQQTADVVRSVLSLGVEKAVSLSGAAKGEVKQQSKAKAPSTAARPAETAPG
jgi:PTH1 family peptidyl-tRNA hydrolase